MDFQSKKLINDPNGLNNSSLATVFFFFLVFNFTIFSSAFPFVDLLLNFGFYVVTEFIEGLVETYPGLQYLDGFPEVKVVLRADVSGAKYDKVAVISGGGSGHEPAHAGFVGEGMLTAAICGDIFASPPVDSILAGIRAVTGPLGCLLIVKNYTGDRLNFGLAAEQAKSEGYKVEMVIVGDDCALPPPRGIAGRRGLAGTILVHKVAGAAAACGLSLAEVAAEAKRASEMVGTMGVALSVCTLPGQVTPDRLGPGKMELGLGIHGEPGAAVADLQPVDIVVSHVLTQILSSIRGHSSYGTDDCGRKVVPRLQLEHGLAVERVYTGSFMTSLDMAGFSITVMNAEQTILNRLDAPTKAPNWPVGVDGSHPPAKIPVPLPPSHSKRMMRKMLTATAVINLKDSLNDWDSKVGDGDCGSTMFRGASTILEDMKKCYPLNDPAETVSEIGSSIRKVMGGTSGIIYDIFIKAAYAQLKANSQSGITALQWAGALEAAIAAVSKYGASSVVKEKLAAGEDPVEAFALSAEAAFAGAESTKNMQAQTKCDILNHYAYKLFSRGRDNIDFAITNMDLSQSITSILGGRSSYVSADILASVPDPGAMAAASWYKAAVLALMHKAGNFGKSASSVRRDWPHVASPMRLSGDG
ncbi:hypothetical protein DH2020_013525 [Rehmannia glutinosa]|uniref:3,4-dihydroxy-2-butanone kinase n=1 Tax=Rehmannia glutinosa TaxID=99300 RepID=A0ABR0X526_REHGL